MTTVRRGVTLVELLSVLVLLAIVGGAIGRLLVRQQRFYVALHERLALRSQLRDGVDLLTVALRYAAVQGAPIDFASDTAVELSSVIGAGTVCAASGAVIHLTPEATASGAALTSFATTPDTADDVLVFHTAGATASAGWSRARVATVGSHPVGGVCGGSPLVSPVDVAAAARSTELTLAPATPALPGAPVRVVRHARFSVYRASDGLWYLGYRRCAPACNGIQPVSGPYAPGTVPPLTLRYADASGATLPTPLDSSARSRITRVDLVLRARSRGIIDLPGFGRGIARDSALATVALRNAP
jgi:prepilin-type N-terminal cleavage/methylation domain-containing protein